MRIFALVTDAFGGEGGIAQYNRDFFTAFAKAGPDNRVIVLPLTANKNIQELPPNIVQKHPLRGRLLYALYALITLRQEGPFDLIFCGHLHIAPLAVLLSRIFHLPLWLQAHGIEAWGKPSRMRRWAAEQSSLITAVSRYTRRKLLTWANVPLHRIRVLPNTVQDKFKPGSKDEELVRRYGLQGKKVLLTTGRLSAAERYKGHDKVISILPELLQKHSDLIYVIAGDADDRPHLEALAKEKGANKSVLFVGKIADREIVDLYRTADVFVMPSTGEGFGIVFLEAMACGVPAVGGNEDGSTDPLQDGMLGSAASRNELVKVIDKALLTTPQQHFELAKSVENYFSESLFRTHLSHLTAELSKDSRHPACGSHELTWDRV